MPTDLEAHPAPLARGAVVALLSSREIPAALSAGEVRGFEVIVRNVGGAAWPAVGDAAGRYAVSLRARWLAADGAPFKDDAAAARIPYDMEPGDTAGLRLEVAAPAAPGLYVLEVGAAQEGADGFGAGRLRARVEVSPKPER